MNFSSLCQTPSFANLTETRRRSLDLFSQSSSGNSAAGLSAQSSSCLGTTASASMGSTPDGTDLSVRSHRGNTADFSARPGGASLNVTREADSNRPSRSEYLAALQANFGC